MIKKKKKQPSPVVEASAPERRCYQLDALQCPVCQQGELAHQVKTGDLECRQCRHVFNVNNGIPVLLKDAEAFTRLDTMAYDEHHNIDELRRE